MILRYKGLSDIKGSLIAIQDVKDLVFDEAVDIYLDDGSSRRGRVIQIEGDKAIIQVFEGTVIKRQGGSSRETFTVRKTSNGIGVEKTWPLHSPNVEKIEVVRAGKVRRAKLNYLRSRVGKAAKVKELVK